MNNAIYFPLLLVSVLVTYLIRAIPFVLFKKKIENKRVQAFFDYIPYAVLSAMTFPAILYSTNSIISAAVGFVIALILAYRGKSLLVVAIGTCLGAFLTSLLLTLVV
ncbi:MAG: AzlD domain-containing protein [Saccharofermentans sp.]|nr:AzlD domain-containing protein [Saccharofermentans sp.]